jgi:methyl-accepting chemotaxis protein
VKEEALVGAIRDLSVGRKLYGSFGLIVLLLICVAAAGLWSTSAMRSDTDAVAHAAELSTAVARLQTLVADGEAAGGVRDRLAELDHDALSAAERANADRASAQLERWGRTGSDAELAGARRSLEQLAAAVHEDRRQAIDAAASTASRSRIAILAVGLVALLLAGAVAFAMTRYITGAIAPLADRLSLLSANCLTQLDHGLGAMAAGDLTFAVEATTTPIPDPGADELGRLAATFNGMLERAQRGLDAYNETRERLAEMVREISSGSAGVSAASQEMAATSEETGRAVLEIATAINEVASGATRQVQTVDRARTAAEETASAATEAQSVAGEGVAAAKQASDAMNLVRESSGQVSDAIGSLAAKSEQIGGIVETITGISDQTNLLALNAAIEAARAGEQGRGFAVVAEEVRKLAEESQQAAATISRLIAEIQAETARTVDVVADGARRSQDSAAVVDQARDAFLQIGQTIADIAGRVQQIADASGDIAAVAEQSSATTEQVSASTEQTSASTEQIAASAQELAGTAEALAQLVARFKVAA